jgi:hypothetical protein
MKAENKTKIERMMNVMTYTFDAGDGFRVDYSIDLDEKVEECWMYHRNYNSKMFMFGGEMGDAVLSIVCGGIPTNICAPENELNEFKEIYRAYFMDDEGKQD